MTPLDPLAARIGDIPLITQEKAVRAKSRDFFWYSPVLKSRLDDVTAEAVVAPRSEAEVVTVLAACHDLDIPVTPRGGGTGNYGQAMPLAGGVVLDMARMTRILELRPGRVVTEAGALMGDIDTAARAELGEELRLHPSTRETATIAGFVAGGSGGVGSIRWGMLAEPGNILRLRIATMESTPRLIDLTGEEIAQVHHAYGVTGVITEVEMPLAPAPDWVEMLIAWPGWTDALAAGHRIACAEGLWLKQLAAVEAPAPHAYFLRHRKFLDAGDNLLCLMVAPNSADALAGLAAGMGGTMRYRSDTAPQDARAGLPHLHHLAWNHTTLRALKTDPEITYLQMGYPEGREIETCAEIARRYPDEIVNHVEFTRSGGRVRFGSLPMVRFTTEARLVALMLELEAMGCPIWNPHAHTLEEGNHRDADPAQIALKKANDPKGLLNPGKMIGWEDPGYRYDPRGGYAYAATGRAVS
ncbi:FAD-linked oxidase [Rhodosalinus halophilus]|uniref:FAD-linked oxidase n=1 Tax=Rhodosalinus halophilus TaxID=2259333 RepID=A0A365U9I1_9RHOB|nr:FAD-binding oxidoreductase [Rhodosalinus halophilus]RBI85614.1 FAD-linked oxidase [Rhodosalinus halophilus]